MHQNKNNKTKYEFDFDHWVKMAATDPEEFDKQRKIVIDALIESTPMPMQKRLRGLQWRIDMEIRRSTNPMDGCLRIHKMMHESVYSPGGLAEALDKLSEGGEPIAPPQNKSSARIIPLKR